MSKFFGQWGEFGGKTWKSSSITYQTLERNVIVIPSLLDKGNYDLSDPLTEGFNAYNVNLLEDHEVVEASIEECIDVFSDDTELNDIIIQASQIYEALTRVERPENVLVEAGDQVFSVMVE